MKPLLRKVHWEWRPGIVRRQAQLIGRNLIASARPAEVTCRTCRRYLEPQALREVSHR